MDNLYSNNMEKYVLSAVLEDPDILSEISLKSDFFYIPENKKIYKKLMYLEKKGEGISPFNLFLLIEGDQLEIRAKEIASEMTTISQAKKAAERLKDLAIKRGLVNAANNIIAEVEEYDREKDSINKLAGKAEELIFEATGKNTDSVDWYEMFDLVEEYHEYQKELTEKDGIVGKTTGFRRLDDFTSGLNNSDLYYLGARPAIGKTMLAINIALNAALNQDKVLFFSIEMQRKKIVERMLANLGRLQSNNLRDGLDLEIEEIEQKYTEALSKAGGRPIIINDKAGINIEELASISRRAYRQDKVDLIIIDYLQKIRAEREPGMNDDSLVKKISNSLAELSKSLDVPVLCLSQLSRNLEYRKNKRPRMSDLRESGNLEQDADGIWFLYRHSRYYPAECEEEGISNIVELIYAKNRHGKTGTILFDFQEPYCAFKEVERFRAAEYRDALRRITER